ncbi:MAG: hypothetical protein ACK44E_07160 [Anaerolineales bacterium]
MKAEKPVQAKAAPPKPRRRKRETTSLPLSASDLQEEIAMLRETLRRFFELGRGCEDIETAANILSVFGLATTRLARLLLAQRELGAERDPLMEAIQTAVAETAKEMSNLAKEL